MSAPEHTPRRTCQATNRAGAPCRAAPLTGTDHCRAHDPTQPEADRFGSPAQSARAGASEKPRTPSVMERLRARVEDEAEAVLAPYFEALAAGQDIEQRMRAAERLLDRVFGRAKQSAELTGAFTLDERTLEGELEAELEALLVARQRNELAAANGDGDR